MDIDANILSTFNQLKSEVNFKKDVRMVNHLANSLLLALEYSNATTTKEDRIAVSYKCEHLAGKHRSRPQKRCSARDWPANPLSERGTSYKVFHHWIDTLGDNLVSRAFWLRFELKSEKPWEEDCPGAQNTVHNMSSRQLLFVGHLQQPGVKWSFCLGLENYRCGV